MTAHRLPDLHAPRYRLPVKGTLNQATYQLLRSQIPAAKALSDSQLKTLLLDVNQTLWQTVVQTRDGVELPEQLGHLFVGACPARKADSIDYKSSALLGERVRHRNWESDGYLAKIFYSTAGTRYQFKHHELWGFQACKRFKQEVGRRFPSQWKLYVQVMPDRKTKSAFFQQNRQLTRQQRQAEQLATYNELDF